MAAITNAACRGIAAHDEYVGQNLRECGVRKALAVVCDVSTDTAPAIPGPCCFVNMLRN